MGYIDNWKKNMGDVWSGINIAKDAVGNYLGSYDRSVSVPQLTTTQNINNAMRNVAAGAIDPGQRAARQKFPTPGYNQASFTERNLEGMTGLAQGSTAARNAQNALEQEILQQNALRNQGRDALRGLGRNSGYGNQDLAAAIDLGYVPPPPPSNFGQTGALDLAALEFADPNYVPPTVIVDDDDDDVPVVIDDDDGGDDGGGGGGGPGGGGGGVPVSDTMRSLFGELSTRDFTEQIAKAMADRAASLRGLDTESRARLAATVARRLTQIGSVETDLAADIASREADRLAQQQGLATQVGTRATGFVGDTTASLTAAREALGPQVTDEFEKIAQIVESQARSQGASSQDAMARLGQVANMAAQERAAAPGQLAAESELALGDEEFAISNQLQQNLSAALAGLDAEEAERVLAEAIRKEQFGNERDRSMINALVGNLIREDTQAFQAGQADLNRGFSKSEREAGELFRTGERLGSETFADLQARAGESYRTSERIAGEKYATGEREAGEKFGLMQDALKETVSQAASELKAQSEATLAAQMGYTPDVWAAMTDGMKSKILENSIQQNILQGQGQGAAPEGTMANFRGKNPDVDPAFFQHLDGLYAFEGMGGTRDEIEIAQEGYLKTLATDAQSSFGEKGLPPREIEEIKSLYNRYKFDIDMALRAQSYQDRFGGAPMAASDAAIAAGPNAADTRYLLGPQ